MKSAVIFLLFFVCALAAGAAPIERAWHVAPPPVGADDHDGSPNRPFATLEHARVVVRSYLAIHELRGDLVVDLHDGTYELAEPVRFDSADSGKNGFHVIYRAASGADVLLSGGRRVTGWTRESGDVFRADVGRQTDFRQLWVNDRRAVRARTPNLGRTLTFAADKQADGFDVPRNLLAGVTLQPGEVEFSVLIAWMHKRLRLAGLADTADPKIARAIIAPGEWDAVLNQPQGDRKYLGREYWLENAREFLDAPGEFFLDQGDGVLRYRPRPGEDPADPATQVVRPELENLIVVEGKLDAPVHHLRFEGLTFAHTGWTRPNRFGFVDVQANSLVPADLGAAADEQYRHRQRKDRISAAFQAATADCIVVRGCRFVRLGGTGVMFTRGGNDNVIEGNSFFDLAAGGIEFGEDAVRPTNPRLIPRRNRIANNFLAHLGEDFFGSVAILGYYTDGSLITHNEMAALPYTGISQGWGWGLPPAPPDSRANRITANRISNIMRRVDDGGGIYTTDAQPGSEIAGNVIERVLPPDPHTKAGGALYLDQFTSGFHVHDNVVSESNRWLYIWNPNIRDNRVELNYADTAAQRNDGTDNLVEAVHLSPNRDWPVAAHTIIAGAGLEPAFTSAREFTRQREIVAESTSVDFQILAGEWKPLELAMQAGEYSAICLESSDPHASARWLPLLPRPGVYDVQVWRTDSTDVAAYSIQHARGETRVMDVRVENKSGSDSARWHSLGRYEFRAGLGAEIRIYRRTMGTAPLRAEAIRLVQSSEK